MMHEISKIYLTYVLEKCKVFCFKNCSFGNHTQNLSNFDKKSPKIGFSVPGLQLPIPIPGSNLEERRRGPGIDNVKMLTVSGIWEIGITDA